MPGRRFSASAWREARGWPQGDWRVATPSAPGGWTRFLIATIGGGGVRTVHDSVCYIQSLYR